MLATNNLFDNVANNVFDPAMLLKEYMAEMGLSNGDFARSLSMPVTPEAVGLWAAGKRMPRTDQIEAIVRVTGGKVTANGLHAACRAAREGEAGLPIPSSLSCDGEGVPRGGLSEASRDTPTASVVSSQANCPGAAGSASVSASGAFLQAEHQAGSEISERVNER